MMPTLSPVVVAVMSARYDKVGIMATLGFQRTYECVISWSTMNMFMFNIHPHEYAYV